MTTTKTFQVYSYATTDNPEMIIHSHFSGARSFYTDGFLGRRLSYLSVQNFGWQIWNFAFRFTERIGRKPDYSKILLISKDYGPCERWRED